MATNWKTVKELNNSRAPKLQEVILKVSRNKHFSTSRREAFTYTNKFGKEVYVDPTYTLENGVGLEKLAINYTMQYKCSGCNVWHNLEKECIFHHYDGEYFPMQTGNKILQVPTDNFKVNWASISGVTHRVDAALKQMEYSESVTNTLATEDEELF
jgi:hypothetical protein